MLAKLDAGQIVNRASLLFRMATNAVSPAVVNVHCLRRRRGGDGMGGMQLGGGNRLSPGLQGAEQGSGVIIDKARGYIVTNNHVVRDADQIVVQLGPGNIVPAELLVRGPEVRPGRSPGEGRIAGGSAVGRLRQARNRRLGARDRQSAWL